jgi:mono/diheme cytochrome c family protein
MNDEKDNLRDEAEPTVGHGSIYLPMWIVGVLGLLVYWAFNYIDARGGHYNELVYAPYTSTNQLASFLPKDETMRLVKRGEIVYGNVCAACHQPNGAGNASQAPPLADSEWVLAEGPNRLIRIPAAGVSGPIKAAGKEFNGSMPALGAPGLMTDEDLAAVLTYIRRAWGHKASPVTVEQVQKVRADIQKNHPDMYTVEELLQLPEQIP